mmetsp:Transcript_10961/g.16760  ORF Transcript_10961/g.16760 Transcript_10961/m.16760 type:complete len:83 (-) Transcript_10961:227-475(-)
MGQELPCSLNDDLPTQERVGTNEKCETKEREKHGDGSVSGVTKPRMRIEDGLTYIKITRGTESSTVTKYMQSTKRWYGQCWD